MHIVGRVYICMWCTMFLKSISFRSALQMQRNFTDWDLSLEKLINQVTNAPPPPITNWGAHTLVRVHVYSFCSPSCSLPHGLIQSPCCLITGTILDVRIIPCPGAPPLKGTPTCHSYIIISLIKSSTSNKVFYVTILLGIKFSSYTNLWTPVY